ncbi:MAG TPA: hypothetical protein VFK05_27840 [Polyangiaceae bacterium]|nr:hypothetical protein [Polyangiaceae bacterium]
MASLVKIAHGATIGVVENGNSAVVVTIGPHAELLDRRTIDLTGPELPTHPHHHEGSWAVGRYLNTPGARRISLAEAVALVERVRAAATLGAQAALDGIAAAVSLPIAGVALRICPELPASTEDCIRDNRAQTYADTVMYRRAIAAAASRRGWGVHWYDRERVRAEAAAVMGRTEIEGYLRDLGKSLGAPWQAPHKLAAAAAIAATSPRAPRARSS